MWVTIMISPAYVIWEDRRTNLGVRRWYDGVKESEIYISVIVLGEIRRGVELLRRRDTIAAGSLEN